MSEMEDATDFTTEFVNSLRQVISPEEFLDLSMSLCERDVKNILCTACLLGGRHLPDEAQAQMLANRELMLRTGNAFQRAIAVPDLDHSPTAGELLFFGALHCASWFLEYPDGPI